MLVLLVIALIIYQYSVKLAVIALSLVVLCHCYPRKRISVIEVAPFQEVTVLNIAVIQQAVQKAVAGFNQFEKFQIDDSLLKECIKLILKEGKIFRELTRKSVYGSEEIAGHCLKIVSYIETLQEGDVEGTDFLEALEDLLLNANKCKTEIDFLAEGYTQIHSRLSNISEFLQEYDRCILTVKNQVDQGIDIVNKEKKSANNAKRVSAWFSVGSFLLSPVTGGFSLAVSAFFTGSVIGHAIAEKQYYIDESRLKGLALELNNLSGSVQNIITETEPIIEIVSMFQVFWDTRVREIETLIKEFEKKKTERMRYKRFEANEVIKKWNEARNQYTSYSTNVRLMLNRAMEQELRGLQFV